MNFKTTFKMFMESSIEVPFSHLQSVQEFVKLTSPEAVQRELKGAENYPEQEVDNYAKERVRQIEHEKKLKDIFKNEPEKIDNYYRAIPGKWNNTNINLNHFSTGKYYLHVAPTANDAKKWVSILLRDGFINSGPVSIIEIDVQGMKDIDPSLEVVEDDDIADKTNTPDANKIITRLSHIDKDYITLVDSYVVKETDAAPDILEEDLSPKRPSTGFKKKKYIKNKGTIKAKEIILYTFTTDKGNKVDVNITPTFEDEYEVDFFVNDTRDDESSSKNAETGRDKEILNGVLYIIKHIEKQLNPKVITFTAWKGEGDSKIVKNMDITKPKIQLQKTIKETTQRINDYKPQVVPPSKFRLDRAKITGEPLKDLYDFDKEKWLNKLNELSTADSETLPQIIADLQLMQTNDKTYKNVYNSIIDPDNILIPTIIKYKEALDSQKPEGTTITRNRRADIYERLMNRYFSDNWIIKKPSLDQFELVRK